MAFRIAYYTPREVRRWRPAQNGSPNARAASGRAAKARDERAPARLSDQHQDCLPVTSHHSTGGEPVTPFLASINGSDAGISKRVGPAEFGRWVQWELAD